MKTIKAKSRNISEDREHWLWEVGSRIREIRRREGFTQAQMLEILDLPRSIQVLSQLERGQGSNLNVDLLFAIMRFLRERRVSLEWFFFGREPDASATPDQADIARFEVMKGRAVELLQEAAAKVRSMTQRSYADVADPDALTRPPAKRAPRARMWRRGYQTIGPEELPADWDRHFAPIINRVAAGSGIDTAEAEAGPPGWADEYVGVENPPAGAIALRVVGHSMEPMYAPGDILIVDPSAGPLRGKPAVVVYRADNQLSDVEACVKIWRPGRAGAITLASVNPEFPVIRLASGAVLRAFRVGEHLPLLVDVTESTP